MVSSITVTTVDWAYDAPLAVFPSPSKSHDVVLLSSDHIKSDFESSMLMWGAVEDKTLSDLFQTPRRGFEFYSGGQ
jgi:hypothetical protein